MIEIEIDLRMPSCKYWSVYIQRIDTMQANATFFRLVSGGHQPHLNQEEDDMEDENQSNFSNFSNYSNFSNFSNSGYLGCTKKRTPCW